MNTIERYNGTIALMIVVGTFAAAALISAVGRVPSQEQRTSDFILIFSTPIPTQPLPTADTRELEALRARVAELDQEQMTPRRHPEAQPVYQAMSVEQQPTPAPAGPGYTAQTDQGPVFIPDSATPVPATGYSGPYLAPQLPTPSGPRVCNGFGDWRDYDAAYASSPACHR